jgi:hypothetical protein
VSISSRVPRASCLTAAKSAATTTRCSNRATGSAALRSQT